MSGKSSFIGKERRKNNLISVRLSEEAEYAIESGLRDTGLSRPAYVRMAIIEKNKADSLKSTT